MILYSSVLVGQNLEIKNKKSLSAIHIYLAVLLKRVGIEMDYRVGETTKKERRIPVITVIILVYHQSIVPFDKYIVLSKMTIKRQLLVTFQRNAGHYCASSLVFLTIQVIM